MCASSSWKIARIVDRGKVAAGHAPVAHRLRHAAHQLPHPGLPLRRPNLPVQVLRGHNVGRRHRPVHRHLHVLLLKDRVALGVGDRRGPPLPLHLVVGRNALLGKTAGKGQSLLGVGGLEGSGWKSVDGPRSWESSRSAKIGETTPQSRRNDSLEVGPGATSQTNGKRGLESTAEFSSLSGSRRVVTPEFRYNPFTAADEKIPLSMVHVNKKPQYLVFCLHFRHLPSKHGHLPVESSKDPCADADFSLQNLPQI